MKSIRKILSLIIGFGLGHLIAKGVMDSNTDEWVTASIMFLAYICMLIYDTKELIKLNKSIENLK